MVGGSNTTFLSEGGQDFGAFNGDLRVYDDANLIIKHNNPLATVNSYGLWVQRKGFLADPKANFIIEATHVQAISGDTTTAVLQPIVGMSTWNKGSNAAGSPDNSYVFKRAEFSQFLILDADIITDSEDFKTTYKNKNVKKNCLWYICYRGNGKSPPRSRSKRKSAIQQR
ncbi:hypothetical protein [Listeria cornellensis]|uniref:hypothetical protein n=1 Tax=Listeria cornellensis TaxID=1494961 RepID=UPI0019D39629|nr:hypothetical protein [Listeria cornellensis]